MSGSWDQRACRDAGQNGTNVWFSSLQREKQEAVAICLTVCPALVECKEYTASQPKPTGNIAQAGRVWP